MASVVSALDNFTPIQQGEKGHIEHGWSYNINERVLQLFFQLTRCDKNRQYELEGTYRKLLDDCKDSPKHMDILYRMALQTRDLVEGKGEYGLGMHLLHGLDREGHNKLVKNALYYYVMNLPMDTSQHPLGSWRDLKYLWSNFDWDEGTSVYMLDLINATLNRDYDVAISNTNGRISLCAKWVPREGSQFKKMFKALAERQFSNYIESAQNTLPFSKQRLLCAKRKAYREYRTLLSCLNLYLDTTQIKQCAKQYSELNWNSVTSVTLNRQRKAFQNINKAGKQRSDEEDRVLGATLFDEWVQNKVEKGETIKGKRVGLNDLVKSALGSNKPTENALLNSQWLDGNDLIGDLGNMIAMCDTSGSMTSDEAYNAAVGLSLRVANKSCIKNRILTFAEKPQWIKVDKDEHFVSNVQKISRSQWGFSTNFTAALTLILQACIDANLQADQVSNLVLAVFSDMQIDCSGNEAVNETMWNKIERMYREAGLKHSGVPWKAPHILFWNLRSTNGFPAVSSQKGVTMFSGFSPVLLNLFCEKGVEGLKSVTPWKMFKETIDKERYDCIMPIDPSLYSPKTQVIQKPSPHKPSPQNPSPTSLDDSIESFCGWDY